MLKPLIASMLLAAGGSAWALPTGGEVVSGNATIANSTTGMDVNQTSQNTAINWQAFDIAPGETVNFRQPDGSSIALNRVLGSDPSSIMGTLTANGRVFLINPNGVLVGADAMVNVGGLVASTLNISDSDFASGKHHFAGAGKGSVVNQGTIQASGGSVALLGANVSNQGVIQATLGTVALAAGNAITLDVAGDGLLNVVVNEGVRDALVQNDGMIQANGGKVVMTARSAGALFESAVNNTGVIRANSIENHNGTIMLTGDMESGTVNMGGTLDVSGSAAGTEGGNIVATGRHVGLQGAQIDASGDAGGGTVLIGGGYEGKDAAVQNAQATYMSADSTINADAGTSGDGGTVVVWADNSTRAHGKITARGGEQSGNGGLIETSGLYLDVANIKIDTRAPNGKVGTWLLDPADVTISNAATSDATETSNVFEPNSGVSESNINVSDLETNLGGADVIVTTKNSGASGTGNGDISVQDAIVWTAPTTLTLNADRDININEAITGTDGSLVANSERNINVNAAITTTTGNLTFDAKNDVSLAAASTITTGNLTAIAGKDVNVAAPITVTTGSVLLIADNNGTGPGAIAGTVLVTCGINCITINTGTLGVRFNPVSYATTNAEIGAYDEHLTGGGTLDAKAWVFGQGENKQYDGLRDATVSGLEPDTTGTPPPVALGAVTNALFDTKDVGTEKLITYETSFNDAAYDLFAPFGTTPGTYVTRADITRAPLTITANDGSKVYGETFPLSPQAFTSEGLVRAETVEGVTLNSAGTVATANVDGSPYAITASDATGGTFNPGNYSISYVAGALTVAPAPLLITANDATKTYGQELTLAPTAFTSAGLVNGDTVASATLTSDGTIATAPVDGSPYAIKASNADGGTFVATNYNIVSADGALVVNPAAVDPTPTDPVDPGPTDPVPTPTDPVPTDPVDPTPTDPTPTDPPITDPVDPPAVVDPVEPDVAAPEPVPTLPLIAVLPEEALRPDTTVYLDQPRDNSEGMELTFATAAANVPAAQLSQMNSPEQVEQINPPVDAYVPPVFAPRQDRF